MSDLIPLRPFQKEALSAITERYRAGVTRQIVSMPTGSGKTILAAHVIKQFGWKTLFLVHRDELVRQSADKIGQIYPNASIGVVKAERNETGADVVIVSAQTVAHEKRLNNLMESFGPEWKHHHSITNRQGGILLISDECHHDRAPSRERFIRELDADLTVGLSATPERADRLGLDKLYQEVVYHFPLLAAVASDQLCRPVGLRIETGESLDDVHTRAGEFVESELAGVVNTGQRNALVVRKWQEHAPDRSRTVAFCVDVAHALAIRDAFRDAGIDAECILGTTPDNERRDILQRFHEGHIRVLTNCMVLTEGYDEPGIDCVLMCRPTKSRSLYIQAVGRSLRKAPGKSNALIIDFADNTLRHKLISFISLAGKDENAAVGSQDEADGSETPELGGEATLDLLDYAERKDQLREYKARWVNLFSQSENAWHQCGSYHVSPDGNGGYVFLYPAKDAPSLFVPAQINRAGAKRLCDRPLDAELAMGLAEGSIASSRLTARDAAWRTRKLPYTPAQLALLHRYGQSCPKGTTRGQAALLIDDAIFTSMIAKMKREHAGFQHAPESVSPVRS